MCVCLCVCLRLRKNKCVYIVLIHLFQTQWYRVERIWVKIQFRNCFQSITKWSVLRYQSVTAWSVLRFQSITMWLAASFRISSRNPCYVFRVLPSDQLYISNAQFRRSLVIDRLRSPKDRLFEPPSGPWSDWKNSSGVLVSHGFQSAADRPSVVCPLNSSLRSALKTEV